MCGETTAAVVAELSCTGKAALWFLRYCNHNNNTAGYGGDLATPAVHLRLANATATTLLQSSGNIIAPAVVLELSDFYNATVSSDSSTNVEVSPVSEFGSAVIAQATLGVIAFS